MAPIESLLLKYYSLNPGADAGSFEEVLTRGILQRVFQTFGRDSTRRRTVLPPIPDPFDFGKLNLPLSTGEIVLGSVSIALAHCTKGLLYVMHMCYMVCANSASANCASCKLY
jgi:hypothetical protein